MALSPTTILTLSLLLLLSILSSAKVVEDEEFSEELLLKPLPDRKILTHFHFQTEAPISDDSFARHHHVFPKSIAQLADANKAAILRRILDKFRGRSSESTQPQQPSSSSSFITPKLFLKVLLVAGIAVIWQYYLK